MRFSNFSGQSDESRKTSDFVVATFGAFLARLSGIDIFDVGYTDSESQNEIAGLENLFTRQVPLRFKVDCLQNFNNFLQTTQDEIESVNNHKTYAQDLLTRFPQLRSLSEEKFTFPVAIAKVEKIEDYQPTNGNELTLLISESENAFHWIYDRNRIEAENVEKLISHFITFLKRNRCEYSISAFCFALVE